MYKAERMQTVVGLLSDEDFLKYKEMTKEIKRELNELKEELDIPTYCCIY
jgi:hypothetical protein